MIQFNRYRLGIFITCCFWHITVFCQYSPPGGIFPDAVFNDQIKTVQLHKADWETSYPISHIDDQNPLVLEFDELGKTAKNYSYKITHCDADWRQSRLIVNEYATGFPTNYIRHYDYSFNTLIPYVHYSISLPNEDVVLKVSGNYAITVFEDNEDNPVLCKRFCITESMVTIAATAGQARQTAKQREFQQVDFVIRTGNYAIENAAQDVKVVILQNGQWYTALTGLRPLFIRPGELDYRHESATLFPAGNEYRPLDIKSIRYTSTLMQAIEFERPTYHFYPYVDEPRDAGHYLFYEDLDGKYSIQAEKAASPQIEADYVYVHFSLRTNEHTDGQVYVFGAYNDYATNRENLMLYNSDKRQYEATIMLKQGYYNYVYAFVPNKDKTINDTMLEGNYFDTENDYIIFVYHRGRSARYDRLIGINVCNTLHKQ